MKKKSDLATCLLNVFLCTANCVEDVYDTRSAVTPMYEDRAAVPYDFMLKQAIAGLVSVMTLDTEMNFDNERNLVSSFTAKGEKRVPECSSEKSTYYTLLSSDVYTIPDAAISLKGHGDAEINIVSESVAIFPIIKQTNLIDRSSRSITAVTEESGEVAAEYLRINSAHAA